MTSKEIYQILEDAGIDFAVIDVEEGIRHVQFFVDEEYECENA
jgi:sulfopyruvate decarboxylase TPP-binding subunit